MGPSLPKLSITPIFPDFFRFFPVFPWTSSHVPRIPGVQTEKMGEKWGKMGKKRNYGASEDSPDACFGAPGCCSWPRIALKLYCCAEGWGCGDRFVQAHDGGEPCRRPRLTTEPPVCNNRLACATLFATWPASWLFSGPVGSSSGRARRRRSAPRCAPCAAAGRRSAVSLYDSDRSQRGWRRSHCVVEERLRVEVRLILQASRADGRDNGFHCGEENGFRALRPGTASGTTC